VPPHIYHQLLWLQACLKQKQLLLMGGRRELTDARTKTLWHTRHGLVRYFANISLMCDNCRLYEQHHGNDMVRTSSGSPSGLVIICRSCQASSCMLVSSADVCNGSKSDSTAFNVSIFAMGQ
jgi:hypothetical protein